MDHEATLLVTIVAGLVLAFGFGFIAVQLRLPPLVGYLVAGIALGPHTPGFVGDPHVASQLAEVGIILLMFGVGLHFSLRELMAVRWIAVPGAVGQIAVATIIGALIAMSWGWSPGGGLVLGLALSVASTVVVLRALEERNTVMSANGRIAVGWLIVEDLAMVLTLVLLPPVAGLLGATPVVDPHAAAGSGGLADNVFVILALTIAKIAAFAAVVVFVGPRVVPWILSQTARTGSHELFTLSVLAIALGIAFGAAEIFGVSFALGAFCAGIVLSNSELSQRAAAESLPLQNAFAVLFFVSVGMLFDPTIIIRDPLAVIAVLFIILIAKSIGAFIIVLLMGYPISTALTVSASLAQIGEFSFILAGLGIALGLMPAEGRDLILAGALLSVTLNPLVFAFVDPLGKWFQGHPKLAGRLEPHHDARLVSLQAELEAQARAHAPVQLKPDELAAKFLIFADLDARKREELLTLFKPRNAVPGQRLIRAGDKANDVFFISSGAVEVAVGSQKIRLGPGDFFGEMALLSGAPRSADVTAIDYCQLLTLDRDDFNRFIDKHPELRAKIGSIATLREQENKRRFESDTQGA